MGAVLAEQALVRICDLAGRPRGSGFVADGTGTVITSHEAVDGLGRVVVHAPGERSHLAESDGITPLPEWDLALIRTEGLGMAPLLIGAERATAGGSRVRLFTGNGGGDGGGDGGAVQQPDGAWTEAELAGYATTVTYTSTDRFHDLAGALRLTLPESAAARLRLNGRASGSPVLDAETGAVLAVLGTALHAPGAGRRAGFAVPLRTAGLWDAEGQLGTLLARNGATVPGFGPDLNLAGALRLTAATVRTVVDRAAADASRHVDRPEVAQVLGEFTESDASVAALVGRPGTGRTTQLAALAARRAADEGHASHATPAPAPAPAPGPAPAPAPTVWLRGAQLREGDSSVREALGRALGSAAEGGDASRADVVARLAREARRPLLVLLDAPEEMPVRPARELRRWTTATAGWLRASGARMLIACGSEQWAELGELFPAGMLFDGRGASRAGRSSRSEPPPCVRLGDLPAGQAARARELYGLGADDLAAPDAGHPGALRMLADVRAAQGRGAAVGRTGRRDGSRSAPPDRDDIFSAYLDLVALRIARRLGDSTAPPGAVRRLAARAAGALHEAARRCLGKGQGALSRTDFDQLFPRSGGAWTEAVLGVGVLEAAGDQYRFADEEFGDWLQGRHLDVDAALEALVHGRRDGGASAPVPVPRHRIGPVVHALVLCARLEGAEALERRLRPLADVFASGGEGEAVWWAGSLLRSTLLRVPDARPYYGLLRGLAEQFVAEGRLRAGLFGPSFWRRIALPTAQRIGLLRLLLPVDAPRPAAGTGGEERYLDVVGELLEAEPETVRPLLCGWFTDRRPLTGAVQADDDGGDGEVPRPTVASAAQALLYAHRRQATGMTLDLLTDACHPRADELLRELAHEEPSALCRAVARWSHDERTLRQIAAAEYGPRMVRRARSEADRRHLERAARGLLRLPGGGSSLHGPAALTMLLRLPRSSQPGSEGSEGSEGFEGSEAAADERDRTLYAALGLLADTGSAELSDALVDEIGDRPAPALAAVRTRLCERPGSGAHHLTEALAAVRRPDLAVPTAEVVREYAEMHPETAGAALSAFVRRRLAHRPEGCAGLQLLTDALLCTPYAPLRASLARALGALGGPVPQELLGVLLVGERDPAVLDAGLEAVAEGAHASSGTPEGGEAEPGGRGRAELVRQIGLLMARTPEGAARFDRRLAELSREVPGFARLLRAWPEVAPEARSAAISGIAAAPAPALDARGDRRPRYGLSQARVPCVSH